MDTTTTTSPSTENADEHRRLEAYAEGAEGADFQSVKGVFRRIGETGVVGHPWDLVRKAICMRAKELGSDGDSVNQTDGDPANSQAASSFRKVKEGYASFCSELERFSRPPFTIQRVFELLADDNNHSSVGKDRFWRSLFLNVRVTACIDGEGKACEFEEKPRTIVGKAPTATIQEGDPQEDENIASQADTMLGEMDVEMDEADPSDVFGFPDDSGSAEDRDAAISAISNEKGEAEEEEEGEEAHAAMTQSPLSAQQDSESQNASVSYENNSPQAEEEKEEEEKEQQPTLNGDDGDDDDDGDDALSSSNGHGDDCQRSSDSPQPSESADLYADLDAPTAAVTEQGESLHSNNDGSSKDANTAASLPGKRSHADSSLATNDVSITSTRDSTAAKSSREHNNTQQESGEPVTKIAKN